MFLKFDPSDAEYGITATWVGNLAEIRNAN